MPVNRIERYRNSDIMTADPAVIIRYLLEESITAVRSAAAYCRDGRIFERGRSASRAVELLAALMVNLNADQSPEVAGGLRRLYDYCQYRVIEGHIRGDVKSFEAALPVLSDILEAWVTVLERERNAGAAEAPATNAAAETAETADEAEPAWA